MTFLGGILAYSNVFVDVDGVLIARTTFGCLEPLNMVRSFGGTVFGFKYYHSCERALFLRNNVTRKLKPGQPLSFRITRS